MGAAALEDGRDAAGGPSPASLARVTIIAIVGQAIPCFSLVTDSLFQAGGLESYGVRYGYGVDSSSGDK